MLTPGQRVWHKEKGWGTLREVNPRSGGKTGRPTALVDWESHRVQDWKHGATCSWVSLSSLSAEGPASGRAHHRRAATRRCTVRAFRARSARV